MLFFSGFALYGAMLLLPLFYQEARGATAADRGLMLVPQGIGALLCRGIAGRLTDRIGARPIAFVGFVVVAARTVPFCFADPKTNSWLLGAVAAGRAASGSAPSRSRSWRSRTSGSTAPRSPTRAC